uniref:CCHC-type domain-containing protein n=1 Tax=Tanacetum cinerariifolium TaxID=118510 RepID=A0A699I6E9_TANCI|nr:hypothetical protein [Tanacetum cinerariifolium]
MTDETFAEKVKRMIIEDNKNREKFLRKLESEAVNTPLVNAIRKTIDYTRHLQELVSNMTKIKELSTVHAVSKCIVENVLVKIQNLIFTVDFIILDIIEEDKVPIILGRPMLATAHAKIDLFRKKISLEVGTEQVVFNANNGTSPSTISLVCVMNDYNVIDDLASKEDNDPEQGYAKEFGSHCKFGNQRMMNVAGARENVGSLVVQQSRIQCFNCKEFRHFAKECRKPKRVKDSAYHKEKMLLCKQAEQGVPLQAEQYDWLADTNEEVDKQELEAHYSYMAKIQEQSDSISNTSLMETYDSNVIPDSPDMCDDDIHNDQNDVESDDERVVLANLIANLKLDVDEKKKIQKKLKKTNTTLAQELKECKTILAETSKSLGESISVQDSCLVALQTKHAKFEKYKAFNDRTVDYDKLERKLNETLGQLALKDIEIIEGLKTKAYEILVVKEKHDELMKQSLFN